MSRPSTCTHGVNKRKLANGRCADCNNEYASNYYRRNKEKVLAKAAARRTYISSLVKADTKKG